MFRFDTLRRGTGFSFVKGCRADCEKKLVEGFAPYAKGFTANVSAAHIEPLLRAYIDAQEEPMFLFLEVPCNLKDEPLDEQGRVITPHVNVYYWDDISQTEAHEVLSAYGDWLINDGFACFGFGVKSFASEIMMAAYNVISVYTTDPEREKRLLRQHLPECRELRTAWDYFSKDHPGECCRYERDGKNIFGVVQELQQRGLYFAERREA